VLAYRAYERLVLARIDWAWQTSALQRLCTACPRLPAQPPFLETASLNTPEAAAFIRRCGPDVMLARCKTRLKRDVFALPPRGTFVPHPGVCPEYRNAHGCFWALANDDLQKVGATLLKVDEGVDTGPVYGYFGYAYDEFAESPFVIQGRVVVKNLDVSHG
jgi:formyl transferase-like protein